jgi:hypothetical protein
MVRREERAMSKIRSVLSSAAVVATLAGCAPAQAIRVVSADTSHICSETFGSGLNPNQVYGETLRPNPGFSLLDWALRYQVDAPRRKAPMKRPFLAV